MSHPSVSTETQSTSEMSYVSEMMLRIFEVACFREKAITGRDKVLKTRDIK